MTLDAVTVFRSLDERPINKVVRRKPDGSIEKKVAEHSHRFRAHTVPVPDLETLAEVLRTVGEHPDQAISLSIFTDPPADHFIVLPMAELAAKVGVDLNDRTAIAGWHAIDGEWAVARTKENMVQGAWLLFDRDVVPDMPPALADLDFTTWCAAIDLLFPGFAAAGCVTVPSTSTRVTVEGEPMTSRSYHVFVRVDDATDIPRAWSQATARALITEHAGTLLAFPKLKRSRTTNEIVAIDHATIYDRSTAAPTRLVFDGAPIVRGDGFAVLPPVVEVHPGPVLKLSNVINLTPRKEVGEITATLARITGTRQKAKLQHAPGRDGKPVVSGVYIPTADLTFDLELETEAGWTTVGALYSSGVGHTRCQSPFRESSSWAAYYGVHADGMPFVFDTGTNEKHTLRLDALAPMWEVIRTWLIETRQPRFGCSDGRIFSETLGRRITARDIAPTPKIIDRLARASDAPRDNDGRAKRLALPTQFGTWLKVAWGKLLEDLPVEEQTLDVSASAEEAFKQRVSALLTTMVHGERPGHWGRRALGTWCHWYASQQPGQWCRAGSYLAWGRIMDDGFQIAFTHDLAEQLSPTSHREIIEMSPKAFGERCHRYGISTADHQKLSIDSKRRRVIVLKPDYVASLLLATDHGDPLSEALHRSFQGENSDFGPGRDGDPARGKAN